jgi:hypothetical protein
MRDLYYSFPNMADVQEKVSHLRTRAAHLAKVAELTNEQSFRSMAEVYTSFAGCMELLARQLPYKAGDRVRLVRAPDCNNGWASSRHFLVVGAVGTIKAIEIDYLMRDWAVFVEFDEESWLCSFEHEDHKTKRRVKVGDVVPTDPDKRHLYGFKPASVEHLNRGASK